MSYKLNEKGQEVLSDIPVEGFVGDLKVDPLERVKMDIIRAFVSRMDNTVGTDEDGLDYDVDERDDLDFGLTDYEHYAKMLEDYDNNKGLKVDGAHVQYSSKSNSIAQSSSNSDFSTSDNGEVRTDSQNNEGKK